MKKTKHTQGTNDVASELLKRIFVDGYVPDRRYDAEIRRAIKERRK